jgi:hypothetical protein
MTNPFFSTGLPRETSNSQQVPNSPVNDANSPVIEVKEPLPNSVAQLFSVKEPLPNSVAQLFSVKEPLPNSVAQLFSVKRNERDRGGGGGGGTPLNDDSNNDSENEEYPNTEFLEGLVGFDNDKKQTAENISGRANVQNAPPPTKLTRTLTLRFNFYMELQNEDSFKMFNDLINTKLSIIHYGTEKCFISYFSKDLCIYTKPSGMYINWSFNGKQYAFKYTKTKKTYC